MLRYKRSNAEERPHACRGLNGEAAGRNVRRFAIELFTGKPRRKNLRGVGTESPLRRQAANLSAKKIMIWL